MLRGPWLRNLFARATKDVLQRNELTQKDAQNLTMHCNEFARCFEVLTGTKGIPKPALLAALGAIEAAFFAALYVTDDDVRKELRAELKRKNTAAANRARRNDEFQAIIEAQAKRLWLKKSTYSRNHRGTAREIFQRVVAEMRSKGHKLPKSCHPLHDGKRPSERALDTLAKRVARIKRPDK
jgi:hypothetical protein